MQSIGQVILLAMTVMMALGALDRMFSLKLGLAKPFEEGFMAMGVLTLSMVGVVCVAPALSGALARAVTPVFRFLGADPAMIAGILLACDMGGYPLAQSMASSPEAAGFSGMIIASMMGSTIVFTLPVSLTMVEKEDHRLLATAMLAGLCTIPFGGLAGGLLAGYDPRMLLLNSLPIILTSALLALGLYKIPRAMTVGFTWFGRAVIAAITGLLAIAIIEKLTGFVVIPGMTPIDEGLLIVGNIAIVLAGAFPLVVALTRALKKPLGALGRKFGMDESSMAGMIASLANNLSMLAIVKQMNRRGKLVNLAFCVSASFALGDHLGYVAAMSPPLILPTVVGKIVGGACAVAFVLLLDRRSRESAKDGNAA